MAGSRRSKSRAPRAEDVADYVAMMARELKGMVEPHGMSTLAYLLDLVRLEAATQAEKEDNSPLAPDR